MAKAKAEGGKPKADDVRRPASGFVGHDGRERHAIDRAWQRYRLVLVVEDIRQMEARIATGLGQIVRRQVDGSEVHMVPVRDTVVLVVWSPLTQRIVTVLPPSARSRRSLTSSPP